MANLTAGDWLSSYIDDFATLNNDTWPWLYATQEQVYSASLSMKVAYDLQWYTRVLVAAGSAVGIASSIFCIATFWRKAVVKRKGFYIWMLVIGVLDLLYSMAIFPTNFIDMADCITHVAVSSKLFLEATAYGLSAASDFCALGLTLQRFVLICKPKFANMSDSKKRAFVIGGYVVAGLCVIARFVRYALAYQVFEDMSGQSAGNDTLITYGLEYSDLIQTPAFVVLVQFSDVFIPFGILPPMIYFSARIAWAAWTRRTSKIMDSMDAYQRQQARKNTAAMLQLLAVLVAMFLLNQIGYCLYTIAILYSDMHPITFQDSEATLLSYSRNFKFIQVACLFTCVAECLSRSVNFFLYYCCSQQTRKQFGRLIKTLFSKTGK